MAAYQEQGGALSRTWYPGTVDILYQDDFQFDKLYQLVCELADQSISLQMIFFISVKLWF